MKQKLPKQYYTSITTLKEALISVRVTRKKLKETIEIGPSLRVSQLYDRLLALELDGKHKQDKAIKQLLAIEKMIITYASIRFYMKSNNTSTLKSVQIPAYPMHLNDIQSKNIIDWKVLTYPEVIEDILLEQNKVHLGQAKEILFTKSEIVKCIGKNGCVKGTDDILNGRNTYQYLQLIASQNQYFTQVQYGKRYPYPNIRDAITKEDLKSGYKKWRESTSTPPSSRHLENYKALLASDGINNSEVNIFTENMWNIDTIITNLAIKTSTQLKRWTQVIDVMTEKDTGQPKIHRLRVI